MLPRRAVVLLALLALLAGCRPALVWYGHSDDRRHRVEVVEQHGSQWVRVDGRAHEAHDAIALEALGTGGAQVSYAAEDDGAWRMVIDGRVGPRHDAIGGVWRAAHRLAYAAEDDGRWRLWLDGKPGSPFDAILERSVQFSDDSARFAYAAKLGAGVHVVVDARRGPAFDGIAALQFGPGDRVAYVGRRGDRHHAVIDDIVGEPYIGIGEVVLGPTRYAYAALREPDWIAVVDGDEGKPYRRVDELTMSRDDRLAYVATQGGRQQVVLEGEVMRQHAAVARGTLRFAHDGRLAWVGHDDAARMFLDGVPGPAFDQIDAPVFADRRWGYLARRGGRAFAIIDGRESVAYDAVSDLIFSRDGHKHAYVARIGATEMVVHHRGRSAFPKVVAGTLAYDARGEHWACIIGDVRTRRFYLAIDGRPRRRFDLGELAAHTTRATSHDAEVLRRWVAADLECTE